MLYLAQVKKKSNSDGLQLEMLARKKGEHFWELCFPEDMPIPEEYYLNEGILVLIDKGEDKVTIQEAKDWILNVIQEHLSDTAINPEFIQKEQSRLEQWRQELTAQTLELTRMRLEIETRRIELQELAANLMRNNPSSPST